MNEMWCMKGSTYFQISVRHQSLSALQLSLCPRCESWTIITHIVRRKKTGRKVKV